MSVYISFLKATDWIYFLQKVCLHFFVFYFFSWIINRNTDCIQDDLAKQFLTTETLKLNISWSSVEFGSHRLTTPRRTQSHHVRQPPGFTGLWSARYRRSGRAIQILVGRFRKKDQDALTKELFGVAHQQCLLLLVQRLKIQNCHKSFW